ncbi:MAG TPA: type I-D CRISPR-associated helicase Cas3' [Ktedonobacteraceae bacterium]|jgi:CRISPR-associated endonuclease/helicase Cas3
MKPISIGILPVYSEQDPSEIGNMQLHTHQVRTWEAFKDPAVDVIFNVAMTGDGKSVAGYLPAFKDGKHVVAMYPTNELIRDQRQALPRYEQRLGISLPKHEAMDSARISELMRLHDTSDRLEQVRRLIRRNPILLTNPDLVHLIISHQYSWGAKRKELPSELDWQYDYLLFDEFHVFDVPQIISVTNMIGYLATLHQRHPNQYRKKFVFLSATPNGLLNTLLPSGGLQVCSVQSTYSSTPQENYRCILQSCELELDEVSPEKSIELWVEEHLNEISEFFNTHKGSKGAILVNSVATAKRLVAFLKERFRDQPNISIGENTGLTSRQERLASFDKTILVGTSTVDIGVDFKINLLIFESYSAGSFIQRFGRLGRHEGYPIYRAYGLVPRFVLERFAKQIAETTKIERKTFNNIVNEVFPTENDFRRYANRWGVVQAAQVLFDLQTLQKIREKENNRALQEENTALVEALKHRYEQFYGQGDPACSVMTKAINRYKGIKHQTPEMVAELASFRGQSPLSCGVWDKTDATDGHLQTYNLFFLLTNTDFTVIDKEEFMQEVRRKNQQQIGGEEDIQDAKQHNSQEKAFEHQLLYVKINEFVAERQSLLLRTKYDLAQSGQFLHKVMVLDEITVLDPEHPQRDKINGVLKKKNLVCIISDIPPLDLKRQMRLGPLFQVQRIQDSMGSCYSIAFGQDALLLDSELFFRKTRGDNAMML